MFEPTLTNFFFVFFVAMMTLAIKEAFEKIVILIAMKLEKRENDRNMVNKK